MKITRLPSGNYRAEAYLGKDETGKRIRKVFTGTDKKRLQLDVAAYLDTHRDKLSSDSLKAAMTAYIASREAVLSGSTIRAYISIEKGLNERVPELIRESACSISSADIQEIRDTISDVAELEERCADTAALCDKNVIRNIKKGPRRVSAEVLFI